MFWNGVLRIYNCNSCCKRWYFTFNGAECDAPAAIDGVVYMQTGASPNAIKDLHRVRQIEGVCETVSKGTVRVGFWVGNCHGYGNADAYTGWNSVSRIYVEEVPPPAALGVLMGQYTACSFFRDNFLTLIHCFSTLANNSYVQLDTLPHQTYR